MWGLADGDLLQQTAPGYPSGHAHKSNIHIDVFHKNSSSYRSDKGAANILNVGNFNMWTDRDCLTFGSSPQVATGGTTVCELEFLAALHWRSCFHTHSHRLPLCPALAPGSKNGLTDRRMQTQVSVASTCQRGFAYAKSSIWWSVPQAYLYFWLHAVAIKLNIRLQNRTHRRVILQWLLPCFIYSP